MDTQTRQKNRQIKKYLDYQIIRQVFKQINGQRDGETKIYRESLQ